MKPDPSSLRGIPLFAELSDDDLAHLANRLEGRDVAEGSRITPEGASGYSFFVIESGTAEVSSGGVRVAELGPGDHFGEMAILGDGRRVADVVATSPMRLLVMFGTAFREMEADMPQVATRIRDTMQERLSSS